MTPYRKKLLLEILEEKSELTHIAFHISNMARCNEICLWLIRNKITGFKLAQFWRFEHERSYLNMMKYILSKIDKDQIKPIIGGRDYF